MSNKSISQSRTLNKFDLIMQLIKEYRDEPESKLVHHLILDKGYSLTDVAKILKISREGLRVRYPNIYKQSLERRAQRAK